MQLIHRLIIETADTVCLANSPIAPVTRAEFARQFHASLCGPFRVYRLTVDSVGTALVTLYP